MTSWLATDRPDTVEAMRAYTIGAARYAIDTWSEVVARDVAALMRGARAAGWNRRRCTEYARRALHELEAAGLCTSTLEPDRGRGGWAMRVFRSV